MIGILGALAYAVLATLYTLVIYAYRFPRWLVGQVLHDGYRIR